MARIRVNAAISRKIKTILYEKCGPPEHYEEVAARKGIYSPNARTLNRWIEGRTTYINESSLVPFAQTLDISFHELIAELEQDSDAGNIDREIETESLDGGLIWEPEGDSIPASPLNDQLEVSTGVDSDSPAVTNNPPVVERKLWKYTVQWGIGGVVLAVIALVGVSYFFQNESLPTIPLLSPAGMPVDPDSAYVELNYPEQTEKILVRCSINEKYGWQRSIAPVSTLLLPLIGKADYECLIEVDGENLDEAQKTSEPIRFRTQDVERPNLYIPGGEYPEDVSWYQAKVSFNIAALTSTGTRGENSFHFDGQYAWVGDRALYDFNESSFTVHLAFNAAETKEAHLISKAPNNSNSNNSWAIVLDDRPEYREDHKIRVCFINPNSGVNALCASELLDTKKWYTVAFSYNIEESSYSWYINGELVDKGIAQLNITNTNTSLFIGMQEGNPFHTLFKGEIREVRIYKSVVSAGRIRLFDSVFWQTL